MRSFAIVIRKTYFEAKKRRKYAKKKSDLLRLRHIRLRVFVTSFKRKNDVTLSSAMNDVIFQ